MLDHLDAALDHLAAFLVRATAVLFACAGAVGVLVWLAWPEVEESA
jgi:hypothetical protein